MLRNLGALREYQVFLNYPFDEAFAEFEDALHFAVVAANLLPVCAKDLTDPDRPRLDALIDAIRHCRYSGHDFSHIYGDGADNIARMNMPLEMGMAVFHALDTQRQEHRCAFFVPRPHEYHRAASDLAGLDPRCYNSDPRELVAAVYEWLRDVVPSPIFNSVATVDVVGQFDTFKRKISSIRGGRSDGRPTHHEAQELMYRLCGDLRWWEWRQTRFGLEQFPSIVLSLREDA
jgi:hypothetical protein